jgi:hypothetical protein
MYQINIILTWIYTLPGAGDGGTTMSPPKSINIPSFVAIEQ